MYNLHAYILKRGKEERKTTHINIIVQCLRTKTKEILIMLSVIVIRWASCQIICDLNKMILSECKIFKINSLLLVLTASNIY